MAISEQLLEYVLEQLQDLGRLTSRRMFSGVGLYSGGLFFGLLYKDRLYFKTDDTTRPQYEARGSEGFRPRPNTARLKMRYYTVPADVLEDAEELVKWARQAVAVALASENAKPAKRAPSESGRRKEGKGRGGPRGEERRDEGLRNQGHRDGGRRDPGKREQGKRTEGTRKRKPAAAPTAPRTTPKKRAKATR